MSKTTTIVTIKKVADPKAKSEKAKTNTQKENKEKTPRYVVQYPEKKVVFVSSKAMTAFISEYSMCKKDLYDAHAYYKHNNRLLLEKTSATISKISDEKKGNHDEGVLRQLYAELEKLCENIDISMCGYTHFNNLYNHCFNDKIKSMPKSLYEAYCVRNLHPNLFKDECKKWFAGFGMDLHKSMMKFISFNIGVESASIRRWDKVQIQNLSRQKFNKLFLDIVCQVAIDKSVISNAVVARNYDKEDYAYDPFFSSQQYLDMTDLDVDTMTIEDFKAAFDSLGIEYKGITLLAEYKNLFTKSMDAFRFLAYKRTTLSKYDFIKD